MLAHFAKVPCDVINAHTPAEMMAHVARRDGLRIERLPVQTKGGIMTTSAMHTITAHNNGTVTRRRKVCDCGLSVLSSSIFFHRSHLLCASVCICLFMWYIIFSIIFPRCLAAPPELSQRYVSSWEPSCVIINVSISVEMLAGRRRARGARPA